MREHKINDQIMRQNIKMCARILTLPAENKILREKVGKKRILLDEHQKRLLADLGVRIGRKFLSDICSAFSPDTILKWHRELIARKYDGSKNPKPGRPGLSQFVENLIIRFAGANRCWGYGRILGQLKYLGVKVSRQTVANVLKKHGLEPSPDRRNKTTWNEFIKAHWESLAAVDFFTQEVHTLKGLKRYMVLVGIEYSTRKVKIAGIIEQAYGSWMEQIARNLTDPVDGFLKDKRYVIHDRDRLFTRAFRRVLRSSGVKPIRTQAMAPNLNPMIERFIRSVKTECLDRMLIFGEAHLKYVVHSYVEHYHQERPHQGIDNRIIDPPEQGRGAVVCHERLGGLLKSYRRAA